MLTAHSFLHATFDPPPIKCLSIHACSNTRRLSDEGDYLSKKNQVFSSQSVSRQQNENMQMFWLMADRLKADRYFKK